MWLIAPLADVRSTEADKLFKVLQANHQLAPSFFSLRSDRLCLNLEVLGLRPAGDSFRRDVDRMCRGIRATNGLWAPAPATGAVEEEATPCSPPPLNQPCPTTTAPTRTRPAERTLDTLTRTRRPPSPGVFVSLVRCGTAT